MDDWPVIAGCNSSMAGETEDRELDPKLIGPGVAAILDDWSKGKYWRIENDDQVFAQIMLTDEWGDWRNGMLW